MSAVVQCLYIHSIRNFPHFFIKRRMLVFSLTSKVTYIFYFIISMTTVSAVTEKKLAEIHSITGRTAHVQITFLKDKKAGYLKTFFSMTWMNKQSKKVELLKNNLNYLLGNEITKSHLNNHIFQYCGMKISTVTPYFTVTFLITPCTVINRIPSFIGNI